MLISSFGKPALQMHQVTARRCHQEHDQRTRTLPTWRGPWTASWSEDPSRCPLSLQNRAGPVQGTLGTSITPQGKRKGKAGGSPCARIRAQGGRKGRQGAGPTEAAAGGPWPAVDIGAPASSEPSLGAQGEVMRAGYHGDPGSWEEVPALQTGLGSPPGPRPAPHPSTHRLRPPARR